jgi:hypothetical protein
MDGLKKITVPLVPSVLEHVADVLAEDGGATGRQIEGFRLEDVIRDQEDPSWVEHQYGEDDDVYIVAQMETAGLRRCLEALPNLRALEVRICFIQVDDLVRDILLHCVSPVLEELSLSGMLRDSPQLGIAAQALSARAQRGCRPLRSCWLWLYVDHEPLAEGEEPPPWGLNRLLESPALGELEQLCLIANGGDLLSAADADLVTLSKYLSRRGRGAMKHLTVQLGARGPLPEPFLEALRGGALCGLEGRGVGRHLAAALLAQPAAVQALVEGGGCPAATSLMFEDSKAIGWPHDWSVATALAGGAFPAVNHVMLFQLGGRQVRSLAAALTAGGLPALTSLGVVMDTRCSDAHEGLQALAAAAASGALRKLTSLYLTGFPMAPTAVAPLRQMLLNRGGLPELRELTLEADQMKGEHGEAARLLVEALEGGGLLHGLEELGVGFGARSVHSMAQALREGHFPSLVKLDLSKCFSPRTPPLTLIFDAIERSRLPRLHTVLVGQAPNGELGRRIADLRAREGLRNLDVRGELIFWPGEDEDEDEDEYQGPSVAELASALAALTHDT